MTSGYYCAIFPFCGGGKKKKKKTTKKQRHFYDWATTGIPVKKLDPVSRVTGIPGWYWILGIKCSDTTGVVLLK